MHEIQLARLAVIGSLMRMTREPGSIAALVSEYLREVGRPC